VKNYPLYIRRLNDTLNILFLTLGYPNTKETNLYTDLIDEISNNGNKVYVVTSLERRYRRKTTLNKEKDIEVLRVKTGNIQKTNILEKGISTLLIEYQFIREIKKYFNNIRFDLIMYSTPPITFSRVIKVIKKRDGAKSYLLLKDIFPQNAVDLGVIKKTGILYKYFKWKEKSLYLVSDYIGCMSKKNMSYILEQNKYLNKNWVEVCPNSINPKTVQNLTSKERAIFRKREGIPEDAITIIYGGNLGKPQGIGFLEAVIFSNNNRKDIFFLIIGNGTEYYRLKKFIDKRKIENVRIYPYLPKEEFANYLRIADIGLILLDKRFTIPNFPSRLLSYMEYSLPVIAATDENTDIKEIIVEGQFGMWCESGEVEAFTDIIDKLLLNKSSIYDMGEKARLYLEEKFTVNIASKIILQHFMLDNQLL
jgi:glycosyltransferase involved in cell wall biosynthesis